MAIHKLNKTRTTTWDIATSGDTWVLGEKGRIEDPANSPLDYGIHAHVQGSTVDNTTINVNGTIQLDATDAAAVFVVGAGNNINIGDKGHLDVQDSYGIYGYTEAGTLKIGNAGLIEAECGIWSDAAQDSATIINDGRIRATVVGILADGAGTHIANSGNIKSAYHAIEVRSNAGDTNSLLAENATTIVNTGKITGPDFSVWAFGVAVDIRNKGVLNGGVDLHDGNDIVNNRDGTINGDVWLGAGNDVFKGAGGTLNGILYGGAGNDVVTLASPGTVFVEYAGEGFDTVRINSTYMLGENIDNLTLLGKANHAGIGNELDNTLTGNKGANTLYGMDGFDVLNGGRGNDRLHGGDGFDLFFFKPGYGRDTIMDFDPNGELIKLEGFGMVDLDGRIVQKGDNVVITLSDTDRIVLKDMDVADITVADFEIYA